MTDDITIRIIIIIMCELLYVLYTVLYLSIHPSLYN